MCRREWSTSSRIVRGWLISNECRGSGPNRPDTVGGAASIAGAIAAPALRPAGQFRGMPGRCIREGCGQLPEYVYNT
jgi:hypothetical protein